MLKQTFVQLYKELIYVPKRAKVSDKVFRFRMIFSALSIIACTTLMVSFAFAFFSTSVATQDFTIETATYTVTVDGAEDGTYTCPLVYQDEHTFEIQADGTASTGYCKIQVGDQLYYTDQITPGESMTLTIYAAQGTVITFTPQWGTSSYYVNDATCGSEIRHSETPSVTYTVEPAAKLANIAAHYRVSEADILVYNNISAVAVADLSENSTPVLTVGMELKIPGVNPEDPEIKAYAVPYAKYTVEPTASLSAIAEYYDVPVADIVAFNGTDDITAIAELKIPNVDPATPAYAVPYVTYTVEPAAKLDAIAAYYNVSVEDIVAFNGTDDITAIAELKIPYANTEKPAYAVPYVTYTVEPAAKLDAIAAYYSVSVEDIVAFNGTDNLAAIVFLKIPNVDPETPAYAVPYAMYMVEPTATLDAIAAHYGVSVEDIVAFNDTYDLTRIEILKIPNVDPATPPYAVSYVTYTVEPTANLSDIAEHYGVTVEDILLYNGIEYLNVGFELNIPGVDSNAVPYVAPAPEENADQNKDTPKEGEGTNPPASNPPVSDNPGAGEGAGAGKQQPSEGTNPPAGDDADKGNGTGNGEQSGETTPTEGEDNNPPAGDDTGNGEQSGETSPAEGEDNNPPAGNDTGNGEQSGETTPAEGEGTNPPAGDDADEGNDAGNGDQSGEENPTADETATNE